MTTNEQFTAAEKKKILAYYNKMRWSAISKKYRISVKQAKLEYPAHTTCDYSVWNTARNNA